MKRIAVKMNNQEFGKTLKAFALRSLSLFLTLVIAFLVFHTLYSRTDKDLQNNSIVGMELVGERLYSDGTATQSHIDIVNDFFETLNPSLKSRYVEQNWLMILAKSAPTTLTTKTISFNNPNYDHDIYSKLGGLTIPNGKIIYLNTSVDTLEIFEENLIHEFGHCVDFFAGYPSHSDENISVYQKYSVNDLFNDYESSNTTEFFASAYKEYILNTEEVKNKAPELYSFMNDVEKTISDTNPLLINTPGFFRLIIYNIKGITRQL